MRVARAVAAVIVVAAIVLGVVAGNAISRVLVGG